MSLLALILAAAAYAIAAEGVVLRGALGALVALGVCTAAGIPLAWKRALAAGILQIVRAHRLAGTLVRALFQRLLGLDEEGEHGSRGARAAQAIEQLPLNEAASRLRLAVIHQVKASPQGGGLGGALRRAIDRTLLRLIEHLTLARFREEAHQQGGIDLLKVRDELATTADAFIADQIEGAALKTTILLVALATLATLAAACGIAQIPFR